MTIRPIIFSAPMVRALIEGKKTMTRRLATPTSCEFGSIGNGKLTKLYWEGHADWRTAWVDRGFPDRADGSYPGGYLHVPCHDDDETTPPCKVCQLWGWGGTSHRLYPRVTQGDLLWVKEAWQVVRLDTGTVLCAYRANCEGDRFTYAEDGGVEIIQIRQWRTPLHMSRVTSRLTLKVTAARIERLHDITEEDAEAEGCEPHEKPGQWTPRKASFAELWCKLHRQSDWWIANPFVVVITFKVHRCNVGDLADA